jgi:hypothetical protein
LNLALGILPVEIEELGHDEIRYLVVDSGPDKDDSLLQEE